MLRSGKPRRPSGRTYAEQIAAIVRRDIDAGTWPSRLPVEEELAARFGVTRRTVRRGLDILRRQGVIVSRPGWGTFVRPG